MAVLDSIDIPGEFTPVCNACGISLCYDIGEAEYYKYKEFWDNWLCENCDGDGEGALLNWICNNNHIS